VVLPAEATARAERKVTGTKKVALDILRKAIDEAGVTPPASNHIPPNAGTTLIETWRAYAYQGTIMKATSRTPENGHSLAPPKSYKQQI
jgi:hypothetical protein